MSRARLLVALGVVAALLVVIGVGVLLRRSEPAARDDLPTLIERAQTGRITGDQAIELARRLEADVFRDVTPPDDPAPPAAPARLTPKQRESLAQAPRIGRREMMTSARAAFEDATATLLQDPDAKLRAAVLDLRDAGARADAVARLWAQAKEGGASSSAIWRACGALMLASGDDRATTALENARSLNPQDRDLWRMLGFAYARDGRTVDAAGAALVGEAIRAASASNWRAARTRLEQALPLMTDDAARGFVLGQIGDAAAAMENWGDAEASYRAALEVHASGKNIAALSLDSSRLARAQLKQGEEARACQTLRRARAQGAAVTPAEIDQACGVGLRK